MKAVALLNFASYPGILSGGHFMVEANKQLSVGFLASFFITVLSAGFAIVDSDNALWNFPTSQPHAYDWILNGTINVFFWLGPFSSLVFYYIFEAELETNEQKSMDLKGVYNIEWWLRLISQFILALMWFLLAQKHIVLFLVMQVMLYVSIITWDFIVVIMGKKRDLMNLLVHDGIGALLTLGYCVLAWVLYELRIDTGKAGQVPPDKMLLLFFFTMVMAISVTLNVGNIIVAVARAKMHWGWHMLP